jgi:ubiquinone biosynthesis protein UbiJ
VAEATEQFFARLVEQEREPLLDKAKGTIRFELREGKRHQYWRVAIDRGATVVSRGRGEADCTVRADASLFDEIVRGRANAVTSVLRGSIGIEGDLQLLILFQRVFPGPPKARRRRRAVAGRRKRS